MVLQLTVTKGVVTLIPPPDGYDVDFKNPARNGDIACYWLTGVGSVIAVLFLAQRLFVKIRLRRNFGVDDGLLVIAWLFSLAIQAFIVRAFVDKYIGVHVWEMSFTKFQEYYKFSIYIHTIVYAPPTALTKTVLLIFYIQLQNHARWFRWGTYAIMFIQLGASTGILFSSIFACRPIAMGWDVIITNGTCIDRPAMYEATAAFGVIVDVLIISLPIPMVWHLQMSRSKKTGLILMFTLGSITFVTSIIDQTWIAGPITYWVSIEANLLIICASLPTIRQFIRTIAPNLLTSTDNSKYFKGSGSGSRGPIRAIGEISSRDKHARNRTPYDYDGDIMMEILVEAEGDEGIRRNIGDGGDGRQDERGGITKTRTAEVTSYSVHQPIGSEADQGRSFR